VCSSDLNASFRSFGILSLWIMTFPPLYSFSSSARYLVGLQAAMAAINRPADIGCRLVFIATPFFFIIFSLDGRCRIYFIFCRIVFISFFLLLLVGFDFFFANVSSGILRLVLRAVCIPASLFLFFTLPFFHALAEFRAVSHKAVANYEAHTIAVGRVGFHSFHVEATAETSAVGIIVLLEGP